ncbi:maltase glucoamylase and related glycosyl hydrolase family 31 [Chrysochromulina tobinii]|uniref:Maltase glucoamylase and related glycosyl hydrolase family 31 n=1 Tax=Chrysochromulina tobinii TaxID=1460289 RepID=A0A0M0JJ49_9EUKA|nr:maltase glucoamylase and related glycosyl hydrolase family 31 [Chrysochromulina tobinii]|eukprot:KOO26490.1 maltase glucoamylase and related glycosyl hydrolase family 31 [Chrysochromulina sp. CCMP291]
MSALLRSFGGNESDAMLRAAFQALNGLWKQYGLVPGVDFKAALDAADAIGASVHCIDRDVDETLRLLRGALGEVDLARFMTTLPPKELMAGMLRGGSIGDVVESLKDRAQVAALRRHLNRAAPSIVEVMLHQRDRLMVKQLRRQVPQGVVVAVVGLAHMDGIEHEWLLQDDLQTGHS